MELSWLMRLRIAAAAAIGIVLIGFLAWPLAAPEPFGVVSVFADGIGLSDIITLAALASLAFLAGLLAYFLTWPYGREIGVLAVPFGLAIWAVRCGSMAGLMRIKPSFGERQDLFAALKWEPLFWLVVLAAGFAGVLVGGKIRARPEPGEAKDDSTSNSSVYSSAVVALIGSALIAQLCIAVLARDVKMFDNKLGSVVAQPAIGQIVFAVCISFGLAAFVFKKFLNVSYLWPTIASGVLTFFAIITYVRQDMLEYLVRRWPAPFFPNVVISILPVQMVAFGALGSIAGYWLAVRYNYWRKHA